MLSSGCSHSIAILNSQFSFPGHFFANISNVQISNKLLPTFKSNLLFRISFCTFDVLLVRPSLKYHEFIQLSS